MKKIIDGKRYDTETAFEKIAEYSNGLGLSDFRHCNEELYRTDSGTWFLHGEGGPLTGYSRPVGNLTAGGEDITPLTDDEARGWLERHDFPDVVEKYFEIEDA